MKLGQQHAAVADRLLEARGGHRRVGEAGLLPGQLVDQALDGMVYLGALAQLHPQDAVVEGVLHCLLVPVS